MKTHYQALIDDRLYIGGAADAEEALEQEKVDIIVDLRAESSGSSTLENRVHCPIVDDAAHQEATIKEAVNYVADAYRDGKKVFFHCGSGNGRAGTVAVGTLLALGEAKTIAEAEEKVRKARPTINVKPAMKEALLNIYPDA